MSIIKINNTPIRTSKNFKINNAKLENLNLPEIINSFNNVTINKTDNVLVERSSNQFELSYGLGNVFLNQVKEKANQNIKLIINGEKNEEIQLNYKFDNNNINLINNVEIIADEKTKSNIIIKYESDESTSCFHNGVIRITAKENSNVSIIILNYLNSNSNNFISFQNDIEKNAKLNYTIVDFGGINSITNYYSNIKGEKAENNINTIYLGKDDQYLDLNYIGELYGEKSNINIEVIGALKDNSKKHFKGTIDFKKGSKKAKGNENEYCMLLSDKAKSIALPMLLCSEEDVEGNHSSSAGKIGEKELFYIMSRGFNLKDAMKLMVRAKFNKILDKLDNEEIKNEVIQEIEKRLD